MAVVQAVTVRMVATTPSSVAPVEERRLAAPSGQLTTPRKNRQPMTVHRLADVVAPAATYAGGPASLSPDSTSTSQAPMVTVADPAPTKPSLLRNAIAAARFATPPRASARPLALVSASNLDRRVGLWLDWTGRNPGFDPNQPKYDVSGRK
jgi:hypothetical protein